MRWFTASPVPMAERYAGLSHSGSSFTSSPRRSRSYIRVGDVLVDGNKVSVRCSVTATHTGDGLDCQPTNKPAHFTGMCMVRIKDGKIVEDWNNFDFLSMYQQLGITPR